MDRRPLRCLAASLGKIRSWLASARRHEGVEADGPPRESLWCVSPAGQGFHPGAENRRCTARRNGHPCRPGGAGASDDICIRPLATRSATCGVAWSSSARRAWASRGWPRNPVTVAVTTVGWAGGVEVNVGVDGGRGHTEVVPSAHGRTGWGRPPERSGQRATRLVGGQTSWQSSQP